MRNMFAGGLLLAALSGSIVFAHTGAPEPKAAVAPQPEPQPELTREMFLEDELAPRVQPAAFDTTIVMYTDYQCPYCRKAHVALKDLLAEDKKVRIIYRDWPIFGPASEQSARLAIASKWQDRHGQFHDALMRTPGKLTDESIRAAAKKAGLDWARLQQDLKTHGPAIEALLQRNDVQANALGLDGTPGFIIGETLVPGGIELDGLREMVKEARAKKPGESKTAAADSGTR